MTTETKNALLGWCIIGGAFMLGNKYGYAKGECNAYNKINQAVRTVAENIGKKNEEFKSEEEA